jgi:hypothetical protein
MLMSRIARRSVVGSTLVFMVTLVMAAGPVAPHKKYRSKAPRVVAPVVIADPVLEPLLLTDEDKAIIEKVSLGSVPCELGATVSLTAHPTLAGRFVLEHDKRRYHMVAVPTTTGAIRLEDTSQGAVWLQLANKSMLMDQKHGRRLADACMNAAQVQVAEAMERSPAPNLLEPLPTEAQAVAPPAQASVLATQSATN